MTGLMLMVFMGLCFCGCVTVTKTVNNFFGSLLGAYQGNAGCSTTVDGCMGAVNNDYATDGYYYTVSVKASMALLTIQLFDPVSVETGSDCTDNMGSGATAATAALNDVVTDESTRYVSGVSDYCTGDVLFSGAQVQSTEFTTADPVVGDYLIQVKSNVGGASDNADANNGFSMRAYGSTSSAKESISIAGREKMSA
ncbi:MAG: hypothetical protein QOE58_1400 [Actinomycetota bacterium]|jgi:hypothetical protein|nr:hypothetical protein [Actinomycetota bacterium]